MLDPQAYKKKIANNLLTMYGGEKTLCDSVGVRFYSFLQPTLADTGSKPISEKEAEMCIPEKGVDPRIKIGYDRLREHGRLLKEEGMLFFDTSYIFEDVEETLYYDRAHFIEKGKTWVRSRSLPGMNVRYLSAR